MPAHHYEPDPSATVEALMAWFRDHGKDYPWRRTHDPYAILVSEVMLQQTQIATVLDRGYYRRWMQQFPDWETLATAAESVVLKAWEGLGYYRRARHLQKLAKTIMGEHGGVFPQDRTAILKLPGVGPYTAGAVASFAFNLPHPIVDGNVARVLSRLHNDATPIDSAKGRDLLWQRATTLVQTSTDPRTLNSALMELGQTHCRPTKPSCELCPLRGECRATEPEHLPVKSARPEMTEVTERVFFLRTAEGVLLEQETGSRRTGLWKLPALPESLQAKPPPVLMKSHYGITRYKVTLWVHEPPEGKLPGPETHEIVPHDRLADLPMPSPYRRALNAMLKSHAGELL